MHIILRYSTREYVEAILLAVSSDGLRVVVPNMNDALDLHRVGNQWFSDRGSPVEIESLMTNDADAVARIWHEARPLTGTASC